MRARASSSVSGVARISAVELDPRVIDLARERFDLDRVGAEIVIGDGLEFLALDLADLSSVRRAAGSAGLALAVKPCPRI